MRDRKNPAERATDPRLVGHHYEEALHAAELDLEHDANDLVTHEIVETLTTRIELGEPHPPSTGDGLTDQPAKGTVLGGANA